MKRKASIMSHLTSDSLKNLSRQFGDAFYLLDSDTFEENYRELKEAFSSIYPKFNIAYSYKTNYIPKLCKIIEANGGFAEIVSDMELEIAFRCGVTPSHIIWNGPIKTLSKVEKFLTDGGTVNIDNFEEWEGILDFSKRHKEVSVNIGIRCNYDTGDGILSRFGIDIESEEFDKICKDISESETIELVCLQCHFAKRQLEYWGTRTRKMLEIYEYIGKVYGLVPRRIDLGGALYGHMPKELEVQIGYRMPGYRAYAEESAALVAEYFKDKRDKPMLLIEPGTALAADSMKAVFRVKNIKNVRGKKIAAVLGSQKNISMNGINPPIKIVPGGKEQKKYESIDIAGYTCIESDYLYRNYQGYLAVDDFIVLSNCGSYSIVMKAPFILPDFPILDICKGIEKAEVIKEAENFDNLFQAYAF